MNHSDEEVNTPVFHKLICCVHSTSIVLQKELILTDGILNTWFQTSIIQEEISEVIKRFDAREVNGYTRVTKRQEDINLM